MPTDDPESPEDERDVELCSLTAIFPELVVEQSSDNERKVYLDIEVNLDAPLIVTFAPLLRQDTFASYASVTNEGQSLDQDNAERLRTDSGKPRVSLSHLPSLRCYITLPPSYPSTTAPKIILESSTPWLSNQKHRDLEQHVATLWEENGRSVILYDYIDWLAQGARNAFDINTNSTGPSGLILSRELEAPLLDFDLQAKKRKFTTETFNCGVCLEPKKGSGCHKMTQCGHVFCVLCLQDFYNNCITEGDVASVKCLDPSCASERLKAIPERRRKRVDLTVQPSELLEISLSQEIVQRFVHLKRKKELESNTNVVFCPRRWCKGAARSEKKKKTVEDSDTESEGNTSEPSKPFGDRLAICSECGLAFCNRCLTGPWHGEHVICRPPRTKEELSTEEMATEAYLDAHSARCPTCGAPVQKTMGCNHMVCPVCRTHFCYLCQAYLSERNPYSHFNAPGHGCYMQLFAMDEGDVGHARVDGQIAANDNFDMEFLGGGQSDTDSHDEREEGDERVPAPDPPMRQAAAPLRPNYGFGDDGGIDIVFAADTSSSEEDEVAPPPVNRGGRGGRRGRGRGHGRGAERGRARGRGNEALGGAPHARGRARGGVPNRGHEAARRGLAQHGGRGAPAPGRAGNFRPLAAANAVGGRAGIQRFVQMALRDQEDEWDSDELGSDSDGDWEIPVRGRLP